MMSGDNATLPRSNGGGDHDIQLRVLSNSRRRSDSDTNSDSDTDGDNGGIQLTHPTPHTSNVSQDQGGTWNGNVSGAGTDSNALTANVDGHLERSSSSPRHRSASPHSDGDDVDDRSGSPGAMPIGDHPNAQPTAPTRTPSPLLTQGKLRQYGTRGQNAETARMHVCEQQNDQVTVYVSSLLIRNVLHHLPLLLAP